MSAAMEIAIAAPAADAGAASTHTVSPTSAAAADTDTASPHSELSLLARLQAKKAAATTTANGSSSWSLQPASASASPRTPNPSSASSSPSSRARPFLKGDDNAHKPSPSQLLSHLSSHSARLPSHVAVLAWRVSCHSVILLLLSVSLQSLTCCAAPLLCVCTGWAARPLLRRNSAVNSVSAAAHH